VLELATLEALLRRVEDSQGQVVSLVGEPGMGKTRLVHEFCQRLTPPRVMVLVGRCVAYGQATPYLPVCEMLRQACRLPEGEPPATATAQMHQQLQALGMAAVEAAPYLFHLLGMPDATLRLAGVSPQVIRRRTFTVLHELFLRLGQRQPLLIVVENLHWSDPTSQEYLTELVERLVGMPLLLLVTFRPGYRPDWMEKSYATQVTLARLDPEDSRQVVQAVLHPAPCPEPLLQGIVTKAAGNPLFLEELAWAVQEQGSLPLEVPAMVQAVLAARIDRLPETARSLLQTAAVIGPEGPLALLQAATELPEATLERGLLRLRAAEFLYEAHLGPAPTYVFKHVLTQEAAYQSLLTRTRQQLHQRIARVLEARLPEVCETQPERLAHHYTEAGLQQQAMAYWQQAGQRALERSANAEAIAHLTKALALLQAFPDTPERAQHELHVQTTLGPALMAIKGWGAPEVEAAYTRARALCQQVGETPQLFLVLWGLWRVYSERAEHRTARELGEHLLRLARRLGDRAFLLQAHHALWPTLLYLGELAPAYAHAEQGMALYDLQQHRTHAFVYGGHDPGVCCRQVAALELWFLGYPDQARQQAAAALSLAQEL
jgi:predicted ATPase